MKRKWVSPLYQFHSIKTTIRIISYHIMMRTTQQLEEKWLLWRPLLRHRRFQNCATSSQNQTFCSKFFRLDPIGVLHHRCSLWNFAVATVSIHFLPTTAADGMRLFNTRIQSKSFRSMIPFPIDIYIFRKRPKPLLYFLKLSQCLQILR